MTQAPILLLTIAEVAAQLQLSRRTVESLAASGRLVSVAPSPGGRSLRFRPVDVAAYVASLAPKRPVAVPVTRTQQVKEVSMGEQRYGVIPMNPRAKRRA